MHKPKACQEHLPLNGMIHHSFKQTKPLLSLISLVSSLIIICNHNHFGGRPGVNLANQLLIINRGLLKCMKMIPCSSYSYEGSNTLCSFFLQAGCQSISFPSSQLLNTFSSYHCFFFFYEQVDRKSFWHKINRERCCNGLSLF